MRRLEVMVSAYVWAYVVTQSEASTKHMMLV